MGGDGLLGYFQGKIDGLEIVLTDKTQNLRRLEAQRNQLNSKGARVYTTHLQQKHFVLQTAPAAHTLDFLFRVVRRLREELQLLQEPGSYVGEVIKVMGKNKVLVKVQTSRNSTRVRIVQVILSRYTIPIHHPAPSRGQVCGKVG